MVDDFKKLFLNVCNWNNPWERWNDMLQLFAIEIANSVDTFHREERSKNYAAVAQKYQPNEFRRFSELFGILTNEYERHPFQDYLGDMYMRMEFGSKAHGQFFTPYNVCRMMANTSLPKDLVFDWIDRRGWISVHDCACGAGATLVAAAERLYELGVNYQQSALFVGQDIDYTVAMMCYIQLSLLGCPGHVRVGNTLTEPLTKDILLGDGEAHSWYMPMLFSDVWVGRTYCRVMDDVLNAMPCPAAKPPEEKPPEPQKKKSKLRRKEEKPDGGGTVCQLSIF